jgi:hypothetical protein
MEPTDGSVLDFTDEGVLKGRRIVLGDTFVEL